MKFMDWRQYIERVPDVMLGKPIFRGTRMTVEFVLERLAQGHVQKTWSAAIRR
jgi:uncharacterized protein (DUF433 family)